MAWRCVSQVSLARPTTSTTSTTTTTTTTKALSLSPPSFHTRHSEIFSEEKKKKCQSGLPCTVAGPLTPSLIEGGGERVFPS